MPEKLRLALEFLDRRWGIGLMLAVMLLAIVGAPLFFQWLIMQHWREADQAWRETSERRFGEVGSKLDRILERLAPPQGRPAR